jgi:hypothetical protein
MELSEALREAVSEAVKAPSRGLRLGRRVALPALLSGALVGLLLAVRPRADLAEQGGVRFWVVLVAWGVLLVTALVSVLARGPHGVGTSPRRRWALVGTTLLLFQAVAWGLTEATAHSARGLPSVALHLVCVVVGLAVAALVGVAVGASVRGTAVVSPEASAALAGVSAGLAGVGFLHGYCEVATAAHQALSHGAVLVLATVLGVGMRRRVEP